MGIPSFYRQLCRSYPGLIRAGAAGINEWFCLDFNCAMYHVLRSMEPFESNKEAWEEKFCKAIATYMCDLVALVGPTKGVYVSCDGAVCAAKRRQQRMRRFKGPWISSLEAAVMGKTVTSGWDQNALTPGSAFMARLGDVLTAAGASLQKSLGLPVIVSTTAEGGEGEHKLMAFMRSVKPTSCTIYGLDADLILLAMLLVAEGCSSVSLLREAQEFEGGSVGFRSLDINGFAAALIPKGGSIRDFVAAMSLLGNDFLPRSLTRTVRDDGIPTVIATLQATVWSSGDSLVTADGSLNRELLLRFIEAWAATEEQDLVATVVAALKTADRRPAWAATPEEAMLKEWQAQPSRWASVRQLATGRGLKPGWRSVYQSWHPGTAANYVAGLAWVWDYYSGRSVDQGWMFDEHLPPLWSDVAAHLRLLDAVKPPPVVYPEPLPDWLHLLAVLPAASVATLLPPTKQRLMGQHPWYWPSSWSIFDVGRSQLWECEPVIPMIPEEVLRQQI